MKVTAINHPRLRVVIKSGNEGPRHDSYEYEEMHVTTPNGVVILHEGLGMWISHNGKRINPPKWIRKVPGDICIHEKIERAWMQDQFETLVGHTLHQINRIHRRYASKCKVCGSKDRTWEDGHPGETLAICESCGTVVGSEFNISVVK